MKLIWVICLLLLICTGNGLNKRATRRRVQHSLRKTSKTALHSRLGGPDWARRFVTQRKLGTLPTQASPPPVYVEADAQHPLTHVFVIDNGILQGASDEIDNGLSFGQRHDAAQAILLNIPGANTVESLTETDGGATHGTKVAGQIVNEEHGYGVDAVLYEVKTTDPNGNFVVGTNGNSFRAAFQWVIDKVNGNLPGDNLALEAACVIQVAIFETGAGTLPDTLLNALRQLRCPIILAAAPENEDDPDNDNPVHTDGESVTYNQLDDFDAAIIVSAVGYYQNQWIRRSNKDGARIDIYAPGLEVPDYTGTTVSGSSFASPYVTGYVAALLQAIPELRTHQPSKDIPRLVKDIVLCTGTQIPGTSDYAMW
eukprot:CAMPEP_0115015770 /NCGR_PEP_ID=MMETSP0216-20121206/26991_1 /TAXON_ID=223996 /ORGANISM="Protocruzia adherens, Strain Boccale" /LENGTH=368 /DNA_ID=CAMNT_0002386003 /DNA_START=156 /DNA_END=1259 /DNA_ORIENTATION=+